MMKRWRDAADILIVALIIYSILALIRGTFGPVLKTGEMKDGPRFKYVEAREIAYRRAEVADDAEGGSERFSVNLTDSLLALR